MCTLVVATRMWRDAPLAIAANRDEALGRRSIGPRPAVERGMPVVAPRDLEAGGTWLGINAHGVFVAITNRHNGVRNPDARSRGQLVIDALVEPSVEAAASKVASTRPHEHNPFHLVIADRARADLVCNDAQRIRHETLPPGIHVITERSFDAAPTRRIALIDERLQRLRTETPPTTEQWISLLREHREDAPLEGVCVHAPALDYGTRSSSIVVLNRTLERSVFLHAEGPPCTTALEDRSSLLRTLFGRVADS
jgi:uncharacterized protein with NRDE domain